MNYFTFKRPYDEDGRKILEINILPEKYCTFNCIYCPVSRREPHHQTESPVSFGQVEDSLAELGRRIDEAAPDLVFINSKGEALFNDRLPDVIRFIHSRGLPVRLLSNGWLYGTPAFAEMAAQCDELIGELKSGSDAAAAKAQRPVPGYSVEKHIQNMAQFRSSCKGRFILEISVIRKYSDDDTALELYRRAVRRIRPDVLKVITMEDEPFAGTLGVSAETLAKFSAALHAELQNS